MAITTGGQSPYICRQNQSVNMSVNNSFPGNSAIYVRLIALSRHLLGMSNRHTATLKLVFFLVFYGFAAWQAFFYIYMKDLHFAGWQIGVIAGLSPGISMLVVPFWGIFADKRGRTRMLLLSLLVGSLLLPFYLVNPGFGYYIFITLILALFYTPIGSLLDSVALSHLEKGNSSTYGEIRLWASLGWGVSAVSVGLLLTVIADSYIFVIAPVVLLSAWLLVFKGLNHQEEAKPVNRPKTKDIGVIFKDRQVLAFLFILLIYGISSSPINLMINLYLKEIGATNGQVGLNFALQSLSELPLFYFGQRLIRRYGPQRLIVFAMVVTSLRLLFMWQNQSPTFALMAALSHGVSFSLFLVSIIEYMRRLIPPAYRATGQSLIWAFYFGAGTTFGNILTGILSDYVQMRGAIGIMAGVTVLVIGLTGAWFRLNSRQQVRAPESDESVRATVS